MKTWHIIAITIAILAAPVVFIACGNNDGNGVGGNVIILGSGS